MAKKNVTIGEDAFAVLLVDGLGERGNFAAGLKVVIVAEIDRRQINRGFFIATHDRYFADAGLIKGRHETSE